MTVKLTPQAFGQQVYAVLGKATPSTDHYWQGKHPVSVIVNNADQGRPSSAIIEYPAAPLRLSVIVNELQSSYDRRTLVVGGVVFRQGDRSTQKYRLSALIDEFLAALEVDLHRRLTQPFCFKG